MAQFKVDEGISIVVTSSLIWRDASNVSHVETGLTAAIGDSGVGCMDSTACNYNEAVTEIGACIYADSACLTCSGSIDASGVVVSNDADNDGVYDADVIAGCGDNGACNYNSSATDAAECAYIESGYDCSGSCLADFDLQGICDGFEVLGCICESAFKYETNATADEGSCTFAAPGLDCVGN